MKYLRKIKSSLQYNNCIVYRNTLYIKKQCKEKQVQVREGERSFLMFPLNISCPVIAHCVGYRTHHTASYYSAF